MVNFIEERLRKNLLLFLFFYLRRLLVVVRLDLSKHLQRILLDWRIQVPNQLSDIHPFNQKQQKLFVFFVLFGQLCLLLQMLLHEGFVLNVFLSPLLSRRLSGAAWLRLDLYYHWLGRSDHLLGLHDIQCVRELVFEELFVYQVSLPGHCVRIVTEILLHNQIKQLLS